MWSEIRITTLMSCSIRRSAMPSSARMESKSSFRPSLSRAFSPAAGSSRQSSKGRVHIAPPQKIGAVEPIARRIDCLSLGSGKAADMKKGANSRKDAESKNSASWQSGGASQHVVLRHHQVLQYRHAGE